MHSKRGCGFLVALAASSVITIPALSTDWPDIRPGIWHIRAQRRLPSGKAERWERTSRQCEDPTLLFRGYWGASVLDKAGCQFDAKQIGSSKYQITSECILMHGHRSKALATVTIESDRHFSMFIEVTENNKRLTASEYGELTGKCVKE